MISRIQLRHKSEHGDVFDVEFDVQYQASNEHGPQILDLEFLEAQELVVDGIERPIHDDIVWNAIAEPLMIAIMQRYEEEVIDQINDDIARRRYG